MPRRAAGCGRRLPSPAASRKCAPIVLIAGDRRRRPVGAASFRTAARMPRSYDYLGILGGARRRLGKIDDGFITRLCQARRRSRPAGRARAHMPIGRCLCRRYAGIAAALLAAPPPRIAYRQLRYRFADRRLMPPPAGRCAGTMSSPPTAGTRMAPFPEAADFDCRRRLRGGRRFDSSAILSRYMLRAAQALRVSFS